MKIINNINLSNKQQRAIKIAIEAAKVSSFRSKHGAVLVGKGGCLLNVATNQNVYSSFANRFLHYEGLHYPATRHAEINACLQMPLSSTKGSTIYTVRVSNHKHNILNAKPCKMCQATMEFCQIKKVIYSNGNGSFNCMKL